MQTACGSLHRCHLLRNLCTHSFSRAMGQGAAAAKSAVNRKRANAPGQQPVTAAVGAAKRRSVSDAGKSNTDTRAAADVALGLDQQEQAGAAVEQQAAGGGDSTNSGEASQPLAAAATAAAGQPPPLVAAAAATSGTNPRLQQQTKNKPAAKKAAAAARKPRASSTKPCARAAAVAAAAAAVTAETKGRREEDVDVSSDEEAADAEEGSDEAAAAAVAVAANAGFDEQEVAQIQESLLSWYDRVQRVLPWRRNPHYKGSHQLNTSPANAAAAAAAASGSSSGSSGKQRKPSKKQQAEAEADAVLASARPAPAELSPQQFAYYVWVSEVMLQQTQVSRVVTYFNKWISTWPTVSALAGASQEDVNQVWAGLGYYRRAKYLLDGAKHIVNKLDGKFPQTAAGLRHIPGIGPYTAAAVASIAFGDKAAAVDGNVIRVCARLRALRGNPARMAKVWDRLAAQLLNHERPGCHNQAMMELGATVCKPVNPSCETCPVSRCCAAYKLVAAHEAAGGCGDLEDAPRVTDYPEKVAKAAKAEQQVAVCVVKVLLLPGVTTPQTVAEAAAAAAGSSHGNKSAGPGAAGKGSIRSFFKPAGKQQQQQQQQQEGAAAAIAGKAGEAEQQQQLQVCESELLAAGASAHYLLVQRPDTGVLAGLWEFPGVVIDCDPTPTARRAAVDSYMAGSLSMVFPASAHSTVGACSSKRAKNAATGAPTAAAGVHVVHRRQLGSVVHNFSHIRQTLNAEEMVLLAPSLDAVCQMVASAIQIPSQAVPSQAARKADAATEASDEAESGAGNAEDRQKATGKKRRQSAAAAATAAVRPAVRWVAAADMVQAGLTSGVRKVFNLCLK